MVLEKGEGSLRDGYGWGSFSSRYACLGGESEDSRKGIVVGVIVPLPERKKME